MRHTFFLTCIIVNISVLHSFPVFADWYGTEGNDTYTYNDNFSIFHGTISGSPVGGNHGVLDNNNQITLYGSFIGYIYGSDNAGGGSGGTNIINLEDSIVQNSVYGSRNTGAFSVGGGNSIATNVLTNVFGDIYGSYNTGYSSEGGSNTIHSAGVHGNIYGSYNLLDHTSGGTNTIIIEDHVRNNVFGSYNAGDYSNGGSNTITNSTSIDNHIYGSYNEGRDSSGGSNSITNNGEVAGNIYGSYNEGRDSSGGSNSITNNGIVEGDVWGIFGYQPPDSVTGGSTITNAGRVDGFIYGSSGDDTIIVVGGSSLGKYADGGSGTDTLGFNNMRSVNSILLGSTSIYRNFENLAIYGGSTTLVGAWRFTGSTSVNQGTLNVNDTLNSASLSILSDGLMNAYDSITTAGATTVAGTLNLHPGSSLSSVSLDIQPGGVTNISTLTTISGTTTVAGTLNLLSGGFLIASSLDIQAGGMTDITSSATISGATTVAGSLNLQSGSSFNTDSLNIVSGGVADIAIPTTIPGTTTVAGTLNLLPGGSLSGASLDIQTDGVTDIASSATISGATTVAGSLNLQSGSSFNTDSLNIVSGGVTDISTPITIPGITTVAGTLSVLSGGSLSGASLDIQTGGVTDISSSANISGVTTVAGALNLLPGGSFNTDFLDIQAGSTMDIKSNSHVTVTSPSTVSGTMILNGELTNPTVNIMSTGLLSGSGVVNGNVINSGIIRPGNSIGTLTINGDYSGNGTLLMEVDFASSSADRLAVTGNVSADGTIDIYDITHGTNNSTTEIELITATTDSDKSDEKFVLASNDRYNGQTNLGRWAGSPYVWKLKTSGNNWVLGDAYEVIANNITTSKPAVVSEIPAYISLPTFSYEVVENKLETLQQRLGELRINSGAEREPNRINGWMRTTVAGFSFDAESNFEMDGRYGLTELGFDRKIQLDGQNTLYPGIFGGYTSGDFKNDGKGNNYGSLYSADTEIKGWSCGAYLTWFNKEGYYVDLVIDYMSLDADIEAVDHYATDGTVFDGSVEAGHTFLIGSQVIVEPQAELKVADVQWDSFNDGWNKVKFEDHTYLTGRLGLRAEKTLTSESGSVLKPWLYTGVQHEFTDSPSVNYIVDFESHQYDTTANLQTGLTWHLTKMIQLYGDMGYSTDFTDYNSYRLDFGFRLIW